MEIANSQPLAFVLPENVNQTALLLIDFQGDFCDASHSFIGAMKGPVAANQAALLPAQQVLQAARRAGIRIVHTLEAHIPDLHDLSFSKFRRSRLVADEPVIGVDGGNGRMLTRGSPCNGFMPQVAWQDGEVALHKPGKGAFCDTELRARLEGVTHLLFCGVTTECCVQTTMREANDRGFECLVVQDATASCVAHFKTDTLEQLTAFGAIVGCSAESRDVVAALDKLAASRRLLEPEPPMPTFDTGKLPVIDVSPLVNKLSKPYGEARRGVDADCLRCAKEIDAACRQVGFFYVTGHSLEPPLDRAREFFRLPEADKMAVRALGGEGAGYEPSGAQVLDEGRLGEGIDGTARMGDRKESYIIGKSAPSQRVNPTERIDAQWPDANKLQPGFQERIIAYHDECENFLRTLMRGVALGLGLAADTFDCYTKDAMTKVRLLRYPPLDESYSNGAAGCGSHTDWGSLTLLAQDDVGGLEVYSKKNEWTPAPNIPGALLINVGDMLQLWTGGRYVSAPHRVLKPLTGEERHSIAVFYNGDFDAPIDPGYLEPNKQRRCHGPVFTAEQYILERVKGTYSN